MTEWRPDIQRGWRLGLAFIAGLVLLATGLSLLAALSPVSLLTFFWGLAALIALVGAVLVGYWLWGLLHAFYTLDRNALIIHWGEYQEQLPLRAVQEIYSGDEIAELRLRQVIRWPGHYFGRGTAPQTGPIHFYATSPLTTQIIIRTSELTVAISPARREEFLASLAERQAMGTTQDVGYDYLHPAFFDWEIWQDRPAINLLGSSLILLTLFAGLLSWRYPTLPSAVIFKMNTAGQPLLIAPPSRLVYLGLLGIIFTLLNGGFGFLFYRRQPMVSYFFWGSLLLLQASLWVAMLTILFNNLG
ncbi:MAG: PH domain-containing protein [Chloroflexota bacterium]|nr:PH domain-containing protein [Chloroflexota bacterium]